MRRRQYLAAASAVAVLGLTGCSGGTGGGNGSNGSGDTTTEAATATNEPTATPRAASTDTPNAPEAAATAASTDTSTATTNGTATTANESGGLPDAPGNGTPGTPAGKFTTSAATTPMAADAFTSTLEGRIEEKNLSTAYVINTRADEQVVELTYVASEDNQRKRLEAFAESFVETAARTGGTGGWSLAMTVQTGTEREVWYTWEVRDKWAIQRLTSEISSEEFYAKIEGTTMTPTPSG